MNINQLFPLLSPLALHLFPHPPLCNCFLSTHLFSALHHPTWHLFISQVQVFQR